MSANDRQIAGDHYRNKGRMQHWDMVTEFDLDYFQAQITRYLFRWRRKNGIEDLEKARHYLDKYIEVSTQRMEADIQRMAEEFESEQTTAQEDRAFDEQTMQEQKEERRRQVLNDTYPSNAVVGEKCMLCGKIGDHDPSCARAPKGTFLYRGPDMPLERMPRAGKVPGGSG